VGVRSILPFYLESIARRQGRDPDRRAVEPDLSECRVAARVPMNRSSFMRSNSSPWPIAVRFAISGEAPALSAVTMSPFA
jgi:hypothetical protein